jgi:Lrp/AsnC family leucine-responsive transcriptional regulator
MDSKDYEVIEALRRDSRKSFAKLAEELGMPRATLQDRVRRLTKDGVIKRFTVVPDFSKLGKQITAFVMVSFTPVPGLSQRELAKQIAAIEDVQEVYLISGQWDILVKVRAGKVEDIGGLVIDKIRAIRGVANTETCVSFECVREEF